MGTLCTKSSENVRRTSRSTISSEKPISHYQAKNTATESCLSRIRNTEILNAVADGDCLKVEEILSKGFPVDFKLNDNGWRLLHVAAQIGNVPMIKILLERGARINETDNEETTALMVAVTNNKQDAVIALISAGADTSISDVSGRSPAQVAQRLKYKGIYDALTAS